MLDINPRDITRMTIAPGGDLSESIDFAIGLAGTIGEHDELAPEKGGLVEFSFNGIKFEVRMDSDPQRVYAAYHAAMESKGRITNVGPYPPYSTSIWRPR